MNRAGLRARPAPFDAAALAITLGVFTVPRIAGPAPGIDASWATGLAMAAAQGMHWGQDIAFTYGPWGFLDVPLAVSRAQLLTALLFNAAGFAALWGMLRLSLGHAFGPRTSSVAAAVAVGLLASSAAVTPSTAALAALAGLLVLRMVPEPRVAAGPWVMPLAGAVAGLLLDIKFVEGVALAVLALLVALTGPGRIVRHASQTVVAILGAFVLGWLAAGQALGDLPAYVRTSVALASGYSDAMGAEQPPGLLSYLVAGVLGVAVLAIWVRMGERAGGGRRLAAPAVVAVVAFYGAKSGFTRHDDHDHAYFLLVGVVLCAALALRWRTALTAGLACLALLFASTSWARFDPVAARGAWASDLELVADHSYQGDVLAAARSRAQAAYAVSPGVLVRAQGHPVHVDPWEATAAWAYDLPWRPVPVFQQYAAYTATLDELNATALQHAPDDQAVLLGAPTAIDGRNPRWESPRYELALACGYAPAAQDARWMLLTKVPARCGPPSARGPRVAVRSGQPVTVSTARPGEILLARFTPSSPGIATRLTTLVTKNPSPLVVEVAPGVDFRLPRQLADGPLLVHAPAELGWPASFGGGLDYRSLRFSEDGQVQFEAIAITASG